MTDGLYSDLLERALEAQEQMIYDGFRANTIIINSKKYGRMGHNGWLDWMKREVK